MSANSTNSQSINTTEIVTLGETLPPLTRAAYQLRQRLAEALMSEPDDVRGARIARLIAHVNQRFERRDAQGI